MRLFGCTDYLSWANYLDFILRLFVSALCGALIGIERERHFKNAGMRTHIIVAITSCLMMLISKYGFFDIVGLEGLRLQADASRIAHGVVSAIGFLGAGVIFVRKETIVGLTTAAGMWAIVGIGIAIGAGLYALGIFSTILILFIQKILQNYHKKSHNKYTAHIKCNISKHGKTLPEIKAYLDGYGCDSREYTFSKNEKDETIISVNVLFPSNIDIEKLLNQMLEEKVLDEVEVLPVF